MANNTISTRIALAGAEEIKRILGELGVTGERAFEQVREAVAKANSNLAKVSQAVAEVEQNVARVAHAGRNFSQSVGALGGSLSNFGGALRSTAVRMTVFAGGIAAGAVALGAFARSAIASADEIGKTAQSLGLSVEAYQRLEFAASQAGVKQEQFGTAMRFLTRIVTTEAAAQKKALATFASELTASLERPNIRSLANSAAVNFQQIATAAQRLKQQLQAAGIELPIGVIQDKLLAMARGGIEAQKQLEVLIGETLQGGAVALRRLGLEGDQSASALRLLGVRATDAAGNVRSAEDVIADIADAISRLPPGFERTQRVIQLFGEESGTRLLPLLERGGAALRQLGQEFDRTGLQITTAQARIATASNESLFFLGRTIDRVRDQLGVLFAPSVKAAADRFREAVVANWHRLRDLGQTIADEVNPFIDDLVQLLSGQGAAGIRNTWLITAGDAVVAFGQAVQTAVTGIIVPAFNALLRMLGSVAGAINSVFGTDFTGGQLLAALAITRLLGLLTVFITALGVALSAARTLGSGLILLAANFRLVASAIRAIGITLLTLLPGPILAALAVLAGAFLLLRDNGELAKRGLRGIGVEAGVAERAVNDLLRRIQQFRATLARDGLFAALVEQVRNLREQIAQVSIRIDLQAALASVEQVVAGIRQRIVDALGAIRLTFDPVAGEEAALALGARMIAILRDTVIPALESLFRGLNIPIDFSAVQGAVNAVVASIRSAIGSLVPAWDSVVSGWRSVFTSFKNFVSGVISTVSDLVDRLLGRISTARQEAQALQGAGGGGFARGGYTGDAGRARVAGVVHGGEYVEPAWVVAQPGVRAFLETLRRSGDLQSAIARFARGFDLGGYVDGLQASLASMAPAPRALPGFQQGGLVPALAGGGGKSFGTLDLAIGSGARRGTFRVLTDEATAERLTRFATLERLRSAGPAPRWER